MNIPEYLNITNEDNMDLMSRYEDNYFDLAIVDPPYFSELGNPKGYYGKQSYSDTGVKRNHYKEFKDWSVPDTKYFNELKRVSKNQIVWGINYYADQVQDHGRIIWDKENDTSSFSNCEIASQSFTKGVFVFRYLWNGMLQKNMKNKEVRIHPTQKPVALYTWLLQNYAKLNQKILDTHLGSGSIAIAIDQANKIEGMNLTLTACELDKDYFNDAMDRISEQCDWQPLLKVEQPKPEQTELKL